MTEEKEFTYEIGGAKYFQRPLVLGQFRQIGMLLKGIKLSDGMEFADYAEVLGEKLPRAIAIVLHQDGVHLKDKDIDALAEKLEFELDNQTAVEVVEDFFDCNPVAALLERLGGAAEKIAGILTETGSKISASS